MREAYCGFNPEKVAAFTEEDKRRLMSNPNIIRNGRKIDAAVCNAKRFLEIQKEFGSFDRYIWGFTDYKQIKNLPYTAVLSVVVIALFMASVTAF